MFRDTIDGARYRAAVLCSRSSASRVVAHLTTLLRTMGLPGKLPLLLVTAVKNQARGDNSDDKQKIVRPTLGRDLQHRHDLLLICATAVIQTKQLDRGVGCLSDVRCEDITCVPQRVRYVEEYHVSNWRED